MNKLVLANISYRDHTTDEGDQLQEGLKLAGWTLAGFGYGDGCADVPTLLERHKPDVVFVQDKRDWDRYNPGGTFGNAALHFERIEALASFPGVVVGVVKDAGSMVDYQRRAMEEIDADLVVTYYHPRNVLAVAPYLAPRKLVRHFHTIDPKGFRGRTVDLSATAKRKRGIVSGAVSSVYPLRHMAVANADRLGLAVLRHPGYGANGSHTRGYLDTLAGFKVHVATASRYHFALRKIIESVAAGCTPITNLPGYDVLPYIDDALVRVPDDVTPEALKEAIDKAEAAWDWERAMRYARLAWTWYDFRVRGELLSNAITEAALAIRH